MAEFISVRRRAARRRREWGSGPPLVMGRAARRRAGWSASRLTADRVEGERLRVLVAEVEHPVEAARQGVEGAIAAGLPAAPVVLHETQGPGLGREAVVPPADPA